MTKETEKALRMFSDVFEVNLFDENDVSFNMACGSVHNSKESAEEDIRLKNLAIHLVSIWWKFKKQC